MLYSIDSIQQEIATLVAQDGSVLRLPVFLLPPGASEGEMVRQTPQGLVPAPAETEKSRRKTQDLLNKILGK